MQDPNEVYTDLPEIARPDESNIKSCIFFVNYLKRKRQEETKVRKNIKKTKAN